MNQMAKAVMDRIEELTEAAEASPGKDPLAVALGRRGGLKGGKARMDSMTAEERRKLPSRLPRRDGGSPRRRSGEASLRAPASVGGGGASRRRSTGVVHRHTSLIRAINGPGAR